MSKSLRRFGGSCAAVLLLFGLKAMHQASVREDLKLGLLARCAGDDLCISVVEQRLDACYDAAEAASNRAPSGSPMASSVQPKTLRACINQGLPPPELPAH